MNETELKCRDWLQSTYRTQVFFNTNRHLFTCGGKQYIARTLQTNRITFTRSECNYISKLDATVVVFSITKEPTMLFPFSDIDWKNHLVHCDKWQLKVYVTGTTTAHPIALTEPQYNELSVVKTLIQNDFGKNYSFGDIIHMLCIGYTTGRSIIMKESQPVLLNQPDEETELYQPDEDEKY